MQPHAEHCHALHPCTPPAGEAEAPDPPDPYPTG